MLEAKENLVRTSFKANFQYLFNIYLRIFVDFMLSKCSYFRCTVFLNVLSKPEFFFFLSSRNSITQLPTRFFAVWIATSTVQNFFRLIE